MRASLLVVSLAVVLGASSLANAQPPPVHAPLARALTGDARVLYDAARELFRAGDYASAFAKFQRALELSHDPRIYWNLAACERKSKHNASVLRLVEVYLREGDGWLSEDDKNEAARAAAAVRGFVGLARVTTRPEEGIDVFVDDVRIGTTPMAKPAWIDTGLRRIRFVKAGFKPLERKEEVQAGSEISWVVELESDTGPPPPPTKPAPAIPVVEAAEVPRAPTARSPSRAGPLVVGGIGLAAAAAGGVLAAITVSEFSRLRNDCGTSCAPSEWETDRTMQTIGDVLLIAGGAAVVASAVWWVAQPTPLRAARAWIAPSPGGLVAGGAF